MGMRVDCQRQMTSCHALVPSSSKPAAMVRSAIFFMRRGATGRGGNRQKGAGAGARDPSTNNTGRHARRTPSTPSSIAVLRLRSRVEFFRILTQTKPGPDCSRRQTTLPIPAIRSRHRFSPPDSYCPNRAQSHARTCFQRLSQQMRKDIYANISIKTLANLIALMA